MCARRTTSYPAAFVARLGYAANRDGIGSISHVQLLTASQIGDGEVRGRHLHIELSENLVFLPEVVHVALHLLKITAGHATGIGQKVGNQQDAAFPNLSVGFRCRRTVGAFSNDAHAGADPANVVAGDLVFHRRRDQNVDFLLYPCLSRVALRSPVPWLSLY